MTRRQSSFKRRVNAVLARVSGYRLTRVTPNSPANAEGRPSPSERAPADARSRLERTRALHRLDTDWYESSRHELDHMYDRLVPGGVLLLDDYGYWEGQRRATDEWLARTDEPLMLFRIGKGRAGVKPRR